MIVRCSENDSYLVELRSLLDCKLFAQSIAALVKTPLCIALTGTLGAGKTQWTRFFAEALGAPSAQISSPTFVLLQKYECHPTVYHIDAYRINDLDEFLELGIEEVLDADAVTLIEWADRFPEILPRNRIALAFEATDNSPDERIVHVRPAGVHARGILSDWYRRISKDSQGDSPGSPAG